VEVDFRVERCSHFGARLVLLILLDVRSVPLDLLHSSYSLFLINVAMVQVFEQLATMHFGLINPPHSFVFEPIAGSDWLLWP
jgi:hypothetical protein